MLGLVAAIILLPAISASVLGPEEFVWMAPLEFEAPEWHSFEDPGVIEAEGLAISVVNRLKVSDAPGPWMRIEARRIEDGWHAWNATFEHRLGAPPRAYDGEIFLLVGDGDPAGGSRQSVHSVLVVNATTGSLERTVPIPEGPVPFGTLTVGHDRLFLAVQRDPPPGEIPGSTSIVALNKVDGQVAWESSIPGYVPSVPSLTAVGVVISTAGTGTFSVDLISGKLQWSVAGNPMSDPLADSMSVYVVSEIAPFLNKISRIEQITGLTIWSSVIPWPDWQPCQPMIVGESVVVVGGDDPAADSMGQSINIASFEIRSGTKSWEVAIPNSWASCRFNPWRAVASETQIFVAGYNYANSSADARVWGFDNRGNLLWQSQWSTAPAVAAGGFLVGLGIARVDHRFDEFQLGHGWVALDLGGGIAQPPSVAFDGPAGDDVHMHDFLEFEDLSQPGGRPIVLRHWTVESRDGYLLGSYGSKLSFSQNYAVDRINVTLTIVDDQWHQSSVMRSYLVLPYEESSSSAPGFASGSLLFLVVILAAYRSRRGSL